MSNHTTRETRAGYPTYGLERQETGAASKRAGIAFDASNQPQILNDAGTVVQYYPSASVTGINVVKLAATGGSASSGVFASAANPFGYDVIITSAVWRITTQSTGASTVDIGVGANATTSNDGLIDGLSGATAGLFNNEDNAGTNGKSAQVWTSSTFLNVAEASGDVDGLVAVLYVTCYRAI